MRDCHRPVVIYIFTKLTLIRLQITDESGGPGGGIIFRQSGSLKPMRVPTYSSRVRLRFTSDASGANAGFLIGLASKNSTNIRVTTVAR